MSQTAQIVLSAKDNASTAIENVKNRVKTLKKESLDSSEGVRKLQGSFENLATGAIGLDGPLGQLGEAFLAFAPGGVVTVAVLAGFTAIAGIIGSYIDAAERSKKITREVGQAMADLAGRGNEFKLTATLKELDELEKKSTSAWRQFWFGADGRLFGFGETNSEKTSKARVAVAQARDALDKEMKTANQNVVKAGQELSVAIAQGQGRGTEQALRVARERLQRVREDAARVALDPNSSATQRSNAAAEVIQAQTAVEQATTAHNDRMKELAKTASEARKKIAEDEAKKLKEAFENSRKANEDQLKSYDTQTESLNKLVSLGVRGDDIYNKVSAAIERQRLVVDAAKNDTVAYAEELDRLNRLLETRKQLDSSKMTSLSALGPAGMMFQAVELLKQKGAELQQQFAEDAKNDKLSEQLDAYAMKATIASDSFQLLFETMNQGGNYAANLLRGFSRMFAGIARQKVSMNIAEGVENLSKAFAAATNPFTAAMAVGYRSAAASNFKAAALWGAVAGAASAGGGGGGGGAGGSGGMDSDRRRDGEFKGESTIIIQGGLLDMSNPEQARSLTSALEVLSGRRVTVLRG